jgi:threonine/homoserine/homoserine lactone efflux protein
VVKWVGVAYLAWLGLRLLRSRGELSLPGEGEPLARPAARAVFLRSFLVAVTNPKGYLFFSAFLPQFVDAALPQTQQYVVLALTFAAIDFGVMFGYAVAGAQAIRLLRERGALWLDRVCGGALLALAGSLALVRRQG